MLLNKLIISFSPLLGARLWDDLDLGARLWDDLDLGARLWDDLDLGAVRG